MKIFASRYGSPQTRQEIDDEDGCPACDMARCPVDKVMFVELEYNDGSKVIRRVVGISEVFGLVLNTCTEVTKEEVEIEMKEALERADINPKYADDDYKRFK